MANRRSFAAPFSEGCGVEFVVLILLIILIALLRSPGRNQPASPLSLPTSTATFLPGTPTLLPATATPIPPPGTPSFDCEAGIEVGKTVHVIYHAVRMRKSPGYVDKDDNKDSLHYMETGDKVVIKAGPRITDGLCWWFIEHQGFQGWTADHSHEGRLLLSANP
jgi:hypothetical protein